MYFIYGFLYLIALIVLLPYFIYREIKSPRYFKNLWQRLGFLPVSLNPQREPSLWVHSVSVGETISVKPIILQLRKMYPDLKIFLSTTTITGHSVAYKSRYPIDGLFYFPLDFSFVCRRFLRLLNPRLLVLMEGELWPNLLRQSKKRNIRVILINGRISLHSYKRYRAIKALFKKVLKKIDIFYMQSKEDAQRIINIGAEKEKVFVSGNLKFDMAGFSVSESKSKELKKIFSINQKDKVIIAGSTHQGEEEIILQAFKQIREEYPAIKLILAPRHPERCSQIETLIRQNRLTYIRRSQLPSSAAKKEYSLYLLDTIGELATLYSLGDIVFVGGSLVPNGGHNILEPAFSGKPVIFGKYMENFQFIASQFLELKAGFQVSDGQELTKCIRLLLKNRKLYEKMGQTARRLIENNRGATKKTMEAIEELFAKTGV